MADPYLELKEEEGGEGGGGGLWCYFLLALLTFLPSAIFFTQSKGAGTQAPEPLLLTYRLHKVITF